MFSHITFGTNNLERALQFYDAILEPLGVVRLLSLPEDGFAGYGPPGEKPGFFVCLPFDEKDATAGNGTHAAFLAPRVRVRTRGRRRPPSWRRPGRRSTPSTRADSHSGRRTKAHRARDPTTTNTTMALTCATTTATSFRPAAMPLPDPAPDGRPRRVQGSP